MLFQFLLFGVPVSVHWTIIFLFLLFFADAFLYLKGSLKIKGSGAYIVAGIISVSFIIFSIFVHEISHATVANVFGYKITSAGITGAFAYVSNEYSLSTIPPNQAFLIAFAGPASNFFLSVLGVPLIFISSRSLPKNTFRYFSIINIKLFRMNLWPIAILDGGRMLNSLIRFVFGTGTWTNYIPVAVSSLFIVFLFLKKRGRFELEQLVEKIP